MTGLRKIVPGSLLVTPCLVGDAPHDDTRSILVPRHQLLHYFDVTGFEVRSKTSVNKKGGQQELNIQAIDWSKIRL